MNAWVLIFAIAWFKGTAITTIDMGSKEACVAAHNKITSGIGLAYNDFAYCLNRSTGEVIKEE